MSIPLSIASQFLKIKIFLFEPNSVLGRANKFMDGMSKKVICYNKNIKFFQKNIQIKFM